MKKFLSLTLVIILVMSLFAGCGKKEESSDKGENSTGGSENNSEQNSENSSSETAEYKLGMGIVVSTASSSGSTAQVDATIAVVVTDADGKIVDCYLDIAENSMDIEDGSVTVGQEYRTKQEKKDDYGMKVASSIDKEWYEQANFFADYVVGKTSSEVASIETTDSGGHLVASDADILAGCTIEISAMISAIVKACADDLSKTFTSDSAPKIGFAAKTTDSDSKDPSEDENGLVAMYTTFGAVVMVDGKVAAALLDAIQPKIGFEESGTIGDITFNGTKRELKDEYGMKAASSIEKEWYEQTGFFTDYVAGKTADEIANIATEDSGGHMVATDADILAGCTIDISEFTSLLARACGR